ncbi:TetR/AcrR family transcriptional regulator [Actinomycetes bacterium KLBMP 9759]
MEERRADRRERMLAAGLELFGTEGRNGTSIERVCQVASVSIRNFYEEFASRDALLVEVHKRIMETSAQAANAACASAGDITLEERLRINFTVGLGTIFADPRAVRVAYTEVLGGGSEVQEYWLAWRANLAGIFRRYRAEEVERGRAEERDSTMAALMAVGAIHELAHAASQRPNEVPLRALVDELVRFTLAAISGPTAAST